MVPQLKLLGEVGKKIRSCVEENDDWMQRTLA